MLFNLVDALDEEQYGQRDFGGEVGELASGVGEAAAVAQAEPGGDGVVNSVAVGVDGAFVGDGVGDLIVAEHFQQAAGSAPGVPVEVTSAGDRVEVSPQSAFLDGATTGVLIVDGGFIDLKFSGLEKFGFDGPVDGSEVAGGGVGPSVVWGMRARSTSSSD